jgi:hypothetical protein
VISSYATKLTNPTSTIKHPIEPRITPKFLLLVKDEEPMRVDPVGKGARVFVLIGAEAEISIGGQKTW